MRKIVYIVMIIFPTLLFAQKGEREGFNWGVNVGMYFPNKAEAYFYDGSPSRPAKLIDVIGVQTNYEKITEDLGDNLAGDPIPGIILYKPAFKVGINLQYYTQPKLSYFLNIDIIRVESYGIFKQELASPSTDPLKESNTVEGTINGLEKRFNIDAGFHIVLDEIKPLIYPFIDLGFVASVLQIDEHTMSIGSFKSSMYYKNLIPGESGNIYNAFGYGPTVGAGIQMPISDSYYTFIGLHCDYLKYNLMNNGFKFSPSVIVRVMF